MGVAVSALFAVGSLVVATLAFMAGEQLFVGPSLAIATFAALMTGCRSTADAGQAASPRTGRPSWPAVERELRRARRHGRQLALTRIRPIGLDINEARAAIEPGLRATDICFVDDESVYVAMPESGPMEGQLAERRLCQEISAHGGTTRTCSASYPSDALTLRGLRTRVGTTPARQHQVVDR